MSYHPIIAPRIHLVKCDICSKQKSDNQVIILKSDLAQPGITKVCVDDFNAANREFMQTFRTILLRMKREGE